MAARGSGGWDTMHVNVPTGSQRHDKLQCSMCVSKQPGRSGGTTHARVYSVRRLSKKQCRLENLPGRKEHRRRLKPPSLHGPPLIGASCHGRNALHFTICGWHQPARRAEPARGQMLTMPFPQIRTRHLDNARAAFRQSVRGKGGQLVGAGRWPAGSRRIDGPIYTPSRNGNAGRKCHRQTAFFSARPFRDEGARQSDVHKHLPFFFCPEVPGLHRGSRQPHQPHICIN